MVNGNYNFIATNGNLNLSLKPSKTQKRSTLQCYKITKNYNYNNLSSGIRLYTLLFIKMTMHLITYLKKPTSFSK
jgi:hypothetical protein